MRGSPRSLWLSMANQAAGYWSGIFANAAKRNQTSFLKALAAKPKPKKPSKAKRR